MAEISLIERIQQSRVIRDSDGIYREMQVRMAYNSGIVSGISLTEQQVRDLFDKRLFSGSANVDDIIETVSHFRCFDYILDSCMKSLTEDYVREINFSLKSGIQFNGRDAKSAGSYRVENTTAFKKTVGYALQKLLKSYKGLKSIGIDDILNLYCRFEQIRPFNDGNGRTGRLIMMKECLANGITPFLYYGNDKIAEQGRLKAIYEQSMKSFRTDIEGI